MWYSFLFFSSFPSPRLLWKRSRDSNKEAHEKLLKWRQTPLKAKKKKKKKVNKHSFFFFFFKPLPYLLPLCAYPCVASTCGTPPFLEKENKTKKQTVFVYNSVCTKWTYIQEEHLEFLSLPSPLSRDSTWLLKEKEEKNLTNKQTALCEKPRGRSR